MITIHGPKQIPSNIQWILNTISGAAAKSEITGMMTVDYYVNGREFGYVVTSHSAKEDLTVSFSVYRNSDQIVVYYGTRSQFNVNGVPNEDVYARKKMFANDEIMPASAFIFKWLTG